MISSEDLSRAQAFGNSEVWNEPEIITRLHAMRDPFHEALAIIVKGVFRNHMRPDDRAIELGSGLGYLLELVPEYKDQLLQTEKGRRVVEYRRQKDPTTRVEVADIYDLPYSDGSFDVVVASGVYDVLNDLPTACRQTRRILSQGGKFINLMADIPCPTPFIREYLAQGYTPFPGTDPDVSLEDQVGFFLVPTADVLPLTAGIGRVSPLLARCMRQYAADPDIMYALYLARSPAVIQLMTTVLSLVPRELPVARTPSLGTMFEDKLVNTLTQSGFRIVERDAPTAQLVASRNEARANFPNHNLFIMEDGASTYLKIDLPEGMTGISANTRVIVAQTV